MAIRGGTAYQSPPSRRHLLTAAPATSAGRPAVPVLPLPVPQVLAEASDARRRKRLSMGGAAVAPHSAFYLRANRPWLLRDHLADRRQVDAFLAPQGD